MKKIKKMGIGGLPAGSPERGGGFSKPTGRRPSVRGRPMPQVQQPAGGGMGPQRQDRPDLVKPAGRPMPQVQQPAGRPMPATQPPVGRPMGNTANQMAGRPMKKGGKASSASKRADGCAAKGKTKGKMI